MSTTLVLGSTSGGRSHHAKSLLSRHDRVTHVVCPPPACTTDSEVTGQLGGPHGERDGWHRVVTTDLPRALIQSRDPVVLDGLDTWVPALLDDVDLAADPDAGSTLVHDLVDQLQVALMAVPVDVVVLSHDPVGPPAAGTAPEHQLTHHLLAAVNRRVGATCGGVHLVVAGRVLDLRDALPAQGAALR